MKYHVPSMYEDTMKIRVNREKEWDKFMAKVQDSRTTTRTEAAMILREMQEYLNCDFPYEKRECPREIIDAFELVCRVAISLAEHPDPIQDDYIASKLYASLKFLSLDNKTYK